MPTYTNNWFEITGRANFEKYVLPLKEIPYLKCLEVGCYEGQTSNWLLNNTNAVLTVMDTFAGGQDLPDEVDLLQRFKDNTEAHKDRIYIEKGKSQEKLREEAPESYDFAYIDGSHLAGDTLEDAVLAFRLLRKGGIMIFDDYTWGAGMGFYDIPRTGIDAFVLVFGNQLEVLERNSQMVIRKM
jgi:predicted O-methyltransferase YrrM